MVPDFVSSAIPVSLTEYDKSHYGYPGAAKVYTALGPHGVVKEEWFLPHNEPSMSVLKQIADHVAAHHIVHSDAMDLVLVSAAEYQSLKQELGVKGEVLMVNGVQIKIGPVSDLPPAIPYAPEIHSGFDLAMAASDATVMLHKAAKALSQMKAAPEGTQDLVKTLLDELHGLADDVETAAEQTPEPVKNMASGFKYPVVIGIAAKSGKAGELIPVQLTGAGQFLLAEAPADIQVGDTAAFKVAAPLATEHALSLIVTDAAPEKNLWPTPVAVPPEFWDPTTVPPTAAPPVDDETLHAAWAETHPESGVKPPRKKKGPKTPVKVYHKSGSDEHGTPQALFDKLDEEFHFDLDVCATAPHEVPGIVGLGETALDPPFTENPSNTVLHPGNAKCPIYFTKDDDALTQEWFGTVWMNPPYTKGQVGVWIKKLVYEMLAGRITRGVALVAARPDTQWFRTAVSYACEVRFLAGRLTFQGSTDAAPFPSAVLVFDPTRVVQLVKFWVWQQNLAVKYFKAGSMGGAYAGKGKSSNAVLQGFSDAPAQGSKTPLKDLLGHPIFPPTPPEVKAGIKTLAAYLADSKIPNGY